MWWEWEWFKKSAIIDSVLKEESEFHRFDNLWRPRTKVGRRLRNSFFSTLRVQTFLRAAGDMVVVVMELHREWNIPFRKMSIIGSYRKSLFHNKVGRFSHVLGTLQFWLVCYLFTLPVIDQRDIINEEKDFEWAYESYFICHLKVILI